MRTMAPAGTLSTSVLAPRVSTAPWAVEFSPKDRLEEINTSGPASVPPANANKPLLIVELPETIRLPPDNVKLVLLTVKPFVMASEPPVTVSGREHVRVLTAVSPVLKTTEASARLMTTLFTAPGTKPPFQFDELCQELSPPAPVHCT